MFVVADIIVVACFLFSHLKLKMSQQRPISGSDFGYEIPLRDPHCLEAIMSKEDLASEQTTDIDGDTADIDRYVLLLALLLYAVIVIMMIHWISFN